MKKLFFTLMALLIASPAFAGVTITCNQPTPGNGRVDINYSVTDANDLVRGFALNVQVSAGTISAVSNVNAKYRIYPGSIVINNGVVTNWGTPVASGLGTSGVTLEMNSLYNKSDPNDIIAYRPAASGLLCSITATATCTVTITGNAIRGNVVFESGAATDVSSSCSVTLGTPPGCACKGDVNGNNVIKSDDIVALVSLYNNYAVEINRVKQILPSNPNWNQCADTTGDNVIKSDDIVKLVSWYNNYAVEVNRVKQIACPHSYQ